ncbi:putative ring finger protein [Toxoplasma gondii p89]|uniref:RING-type E3 ubiquitin transferase n=1 Tax=Toxoplasma gondii p89 TaxID=943119 RepID=A0A086JNK2_TOXGO|nr:putative ring finger protein [Toxoplasma gondii p89]
MVVALRGVLLKLWFLCSALRLPPRAFCWTCLHAWLRRGTYECPVCKAHTTVRNVIPIYGRGAEKHPRDASETGNSGYVVDASAFSPESAAATNGCGELQGAFPRGLGQNGQSLSPRVDRAPVSG